MKKRNLTRDEMGLVFGGLMPPNEFQDAASAKAHCGDGVYVECTGTYACSATDYVGCSCDDGTDAKICEYA